MSAFVVSDKTINRVVTYLSCSNGTRHYAERLGLDISTPKAEKELGEKMFALNVRSVDARYGEGEATKFRPLDYRWKPEVFTNNFQAYKSLSCWLYQCAEGDVPETELYKKLDKIGNFMAHEIVASLPEYEKAEWD
jgi:hypothetical protein